MNDNVKHAVTNPTLWINVGCLLSALILTATQNEWVKQYPTIIVLLGVLNFTITSAMQYMRDLNKPHTPINTVDVHLEEPAVKPEVKPTQETINIKKD